MIQNENKLSRTIYLYINLFIYSPNIKQNEISFTMTSNMINHV